MGLIRQMAAIAAGRTDQKPQSPAQDNAAALEAVKAALAARGIEQKAPTPAPAKAEASGDWIARWKSEQLSMLHSPERMAKVKAGFEKLSAENAIKQRIRDVQAKAAQETPEKARAAVRKQLANR